MIEAGFLLAGIFIGAIGFYLIARNNEKHMDRSRLVDAGIRAACGKEVH